MPAARVTKEPLRLMVEKNDGAILVVTVPEGCRVTFGAFQIAKADRYGNTHATGGPALRIYEGGEGIQLACIPNVVRYQALDKLKVERYAGEGMEEETPETWAASRTVGLLGGNMTEEGYSETAKVYQHPRSVPYPVTTSNHTNKRKGV